MHLCGHSSVEKNFGHVMLGLIIHFLYLSQPSISKICSFINLYIHPSLFWVFGKTFTAFILQAYIHIFSKTSYDQQNFFSNKSWKLSLFTSMLFVARQLFIPIIFFFPSFFFFPYLLSFPFPLFSFFSYLSFVHFLSFLSFFSFSL